MSVAEHVGVTEGSAGPSSVRVRTPCPTMTSARPGSRPAASQAGQHDGRTAAHEGGDAAHNLTSIAQCTIRRLLRVLSNVPRSTAGNGAANTVPATSIPVDPAPVLRLRAAYLRRDRTRREKPTIGDGRHRRRERKPINQCDRFLRPIHQLRSWEQLQPLIPGERRCMRAKRWRLFATRGAGRCIDTDPMNGTFAGYKRPRHCAGAD